LRVYPVEVPMRAEVRLQPGVGVEPDIDLELVPGVNLDLGANELAADLGSPLTSLEVDLLRVAGAVFATDLAERRLAREHSSRLIELTIPVVNRQTFERARDDLAFALHLLSRDAWRLRFVALDGQPEANRTWPDDGGTTLLFSGGLDSLAGAVDLLEAGDPVKLVSHRTGNTRVIGSQNDLLTYLRATFGSVDSVAVRVRPLDGGVSFPADADRETSQRTRSFLFVTLAAIVARRSGRRDIVMMAENGPLAIHVSISVARAGPFSTHTAHPEYLSAAAGVMSTVLGIPITISNPYLYRTKSETISRLVAAHTPAIGEAVSCWKASRQAENHCGACIPCLIRRFALEHQGYAGDVYARDLFAEDLDTLAPSDEGLRNLDDLLRFAARWASGASAENLLRAFPELRNRSLDQAQAIDVYRRFGAEVIGLSGRLPRLAARVRP
jgi:7-cyano-7-deazaguanine synthase in queuosine biosynthesis